MPVTHNLTWQDTGVVRKQAFSFHAGTDLLLSFAKSGVADATGKTLRFVLSDTAEDAPLLDKLHADFNVEDSTDTFTLAIDAAETFDLGNHVYHWEIRQVDAGNNHVLATGNANCTPNPLASGDAPEPADAPDPILSVGLSMPSGFTVSPAAIAATGTFVVSTALSGLVKAAAGGFTALPFVDGSRRLLAETGEFVADSYTHTQASASASWTITHNMGKHPSVTIVDSGGDQVLGEVEYVSANQLIVSFSASFAGVAYLN